MKKILPWVAVFVWIILIFNFSNQPASVSDKLSMGVTKVIFEKISFLVPNSEKQLSHLNNIVRKYAHFLIFLVLGMLVMAGLSSKKKSNRSTFRSVVTGILVCIFFAITDETHQLFVQGRGAQLQDMLIDTAGAMVGIGVYLIVERAIKNRQKVSKNTSKI